MATTTMDKTVKPWMEGIYLPAYRVSEAARYVGVHYNTVSAWHYSGSPILPGRTKGKPLSYLELIEVAFVALFRNLNIDMEVIRKARDYRNSVNHEKPSDNGMNTGEWNHSVRSIEKRYPFASLCFKSDANGILAREHKPGSSEKDITQLIDPDPWEWTDPVHVNENYQFADFDYDHGIVIRWHPAGRDSQVIIDPRIAFGDPTVSGLSTWVILGRHSAGETIPEISDDFGISESAVADALVFEGIHVS